MKLASGWERNGIWFDLEHKVVSWENNRGGRANPLAPAFSSVSAPEARSHSIRLKDETSIPDPGFSDFALGGFLLL